MKRLFFQGFLGAFFFLSFGLCFSGESAFGCPLTERLFNISISSSDRSNIAFTPIYLDGVYPARINRLLVASVETGFFKVLILRLTSKTVNSIPLLYRNKYTDQEVNVKKSDIMPFLLYGCIVFCVFFLKFYEISFWTIDRPLGLV